jgi:hypothetical protein
MSFAHAGGRGSVPKWYEPSLVGSFIMEHGASASIREIHRPGTSMLSSALRI